MLLAAGSAVAALAPIAAAAPLSDNDLAIARVLVAAELLGIDFYQRSIASEKLGKSDAKRFAQLLSNEQEHYQSVAQILSGAGQVPATELDIDMSYPNGTFDSADAINKEAQHRDDHARLLPRRGRRVPGDRYRPGARHDRRERGPARDFFQGTLTGKPFGLAFPGPPLNFDLATEALDQYQT